MTLTQLNTFVLVAQLGSVKAAANAIGVSEPAVSQTLATLRRYLDDPLLTRNDNGMTMTAGGSRFLEIAAKLVVLGAQAEDAVRSAGDAAEQVRLVAPSSMVEFVTGPLADAFTARSAGGIEVHTGVSVTTQMAAMVSQRLADVALGPYLGGDRRLKLVSEAIIPYQMVVFASPDVPFRGSPTTWPWLVEASATDPASDVGQLLHWLGVPESRLSVFPNQSAAWQMAARGAGVAPGIRHLAAHQVLRGELRVIDVQGTPMERSWHVTTLASDRRSAAAAAFRHFLGTADAIRLLRTPIVGMPMSRFRVPVHMAMRG
jgi:LysR family transcriptional regulator, low CO2-responsive transcriptional regulator